MGLKAIREARAKKDKYRGDVIYDVWARGGNPDAVDYDRVADSFHDGVYPEDCANRELHRQEQSRRWTCSKCGATNDGQYCPCEFDEREE